MSSYCLKCRNSHKLFSHKNNVFKKLLRRTRVTLRRIWKKSNHPKRSRPESSESREAEDKKFFPSCRSRFRKKLRSRARANVLWSAFAVFVSERAIDRRLLMSCERARRPVLILRRHDPLKSEILFHSSEVGFDVFSPYEVLRVIRNIALSDFVLESKIPWRLCLLLRIPYELFCSRPWCSRFPKSVLPESFPKRRTNKFLRKFLKFDRLLCFYPDFCKKNETACLQIQSIYGSEIIERELFLKYVGKVFSFGIFSRMDRDSGRFFRENIRFVFV